MFIMINQLTNEVDDVQNPLSFDEAFGLMKEEIDRQLSGSPFVVRRYLEHLKQTKGKYIRAISLLACAEKKDGNIPADAVKLAVAIEILHLATLVHDDVIDNADIRRGKDTLQRKFGKKTAVICGDYLLCRALKLSSSVLNKDYMKLELDIPDYMGKVCLGELNQHVNNGNLDLTVFQYLKIISGKTAALFEASFYCGAVLSSCEKKEYAKYRLMGNYIGMIFQLTDDCIDFEQTVDSAKKPVQSDYEQGVITLPLIYTLKNLTGLKEKAKKSGLTRAQINEAVEKAGGVGYTYSISGKYYKKVMKILDTFELTESKKMRLISILNKASRLG